MKVQQSKYQLKELFSNFAPYLKSQSPFLQDINDPDWYESVMDFLNDFEVLVVGAGGLGCQIVKNLALSGIRKIHLIDMDTIDLTNLNRQFLFRLKDINRKKAEVVAEFVMKRCPGVEVIPHTCKVQEKQFSFYKRFNMIIGGLDNIQARKYLNAIVHQLNVDAEETCCMYIDGATEGFQGQAIVVEPFVTACYNCSLLDGVVTGPKTNYCTIANTPRSPEHCIQYVLELEWQKHYPGVKRDNDNLEHMTWVYEKSLERAKKFNIEGVTEMLTMGVAKNIIPAIASTNALIAAFCTNEAIKIFFNINPKLKNFFYYRGGTSTGSDSYPLALKQGCQSCEMRKNKLAPIQIQIERSQKFSQLLKKIHVANSLVSTQPYVNIPNKFFYNPVDTARKAGKEQKTMKQLLDEGIFSSEHQEIIVTDCGLKGQQIVIVHVVDDTIKQIEQEW